MAVRTLLTGAARLRKERSPPLDSPKPSSRPIGNPMDTKNLIERAKELGRNLRFWKFCLDCGATINRCKAASDAGHIQCCPDCNHSRHEVIPALADALEKSMQDK